MDSDPKYKCETMILRVMHQLFHHYFDFENKLNLDYVPSCITNYKKCNEDHRKNLHGCMITPSGYIDNVVLLDADKSPMFLKLIGDMVNRKEFPYVKNIQYLLELILTINPPNVESYTTNHIITVSSMTFATIVNEFPPCYPVFRSTYLNLTRTKEFFYIGVNANNKNLFQFVITKLKNLISDREGELLNTISSNISLVHSQHNSWDSVIDGDIERDLRPKYQFDLHTRSEKIERLFIILDLLLSLFEYDLSVVLMRENEPYLLLDKLLYVNAMPDELQERLEFEVIILKLFIDCISLNLPTDKIELLSRCVHLLNHITNMRDRTSVKDLLYPCIGTKTTELIHNYEQIMKDNQHLDFNSFLSVLENIKMLRIKLELINSYICKMIDTEFDGSFRHIFEYIKNKIWLKYPENLSTIATDESSEDDDYYDSDDDDETQNRNQHLDQVPGEPVQEEIVTTAYIMSFKNYKYPRLIKDKIQINNFQKMCENNVKELIKLQLKTHIETIYIPKMLPETIIHGDPMGKTSNETICGRCAAAHQSTFNYEEYLNIDEIYKYVYEVIDCYHSIKQCQMNDQNGYNEFKELFENLKLNEVNI